MIKLYDQIDVNFSTVIQVHAGWAIALKKRNFWNTLVSGIIDLVASKGHEHS